MPADLHVHGHPCGWSAARGRGAWLPIPVRILAYLTDQSLHLRRARASFRYHEGRASGQHIVSSAVVSRQVGAREQSRNGAYRGNCIAPGPHRGVR
jgi:hypothetical protein